MNHIVGHHFAKYFADVFSNLSLNPDVLNIKNFKSIATLNFTSNNSEPSTRQ